MTSDSGMRVDRDVQPPSRALDLRLARLHLRMGSLAMARAEYEALVAAAPLDPDDLVHLAEVRWRTGDLAGAGDAAAAHLELGGASGRALGIAAEAAAAIGRTVEAERLAASAERRLEGSVADFFAGMPIRAAWPPEAMEPGQAAPAGGTAPAGSAAPPADPPPATPEVTAGAAVAVATAALSVASPEPPPARAEVTRPPDQGGRLDIARRALSDDRAEIAILHLAIALRHDPGLASTVLDAIDGREGPAFDIVRGDAYRLMGHDVDAQASYALAGEALEALEGFDADGTESHDAPDPGAVR